VREKLPRALGIALQGTIMGILIWLAIVGMIVAQHGARIFRYQGF
jgi:hypothetical protein